MSNATLPQVDVNTITPEEISYLRGEALAAAVETVADSADAAGWSDERFDAALESAYRRIDNHFDEIAVTARKARKAAKQRELVAA